MGCHPYIGIALCHISKRRKLTAFRLEMSHQMRENCHWKNFSWQCHSTILVSITNPLLGLSRGTSCRSEPVGLACFTWATSAGEYVYFPLKLLVQVLVTSLERIMPDLSTPFLLRGLSDSRELGLPLEDIVCKGLDKSKTNISNK